MKRIRWTCANGHDCGTVEDTDDAASEIAIRATRKRFDNGGCDLVTRGNRCGAPVREEPSA